MRLNLGSNRYPAPPPWINVDLEDQRGVHVLADIAERLPFDDGSVRLVYAGHVLEHLSYEEQLPLALDEIDRVLADDGALMVVGPDIDRARTQDEMRAIWPGSDMSEEPGHRHLWKPTRQAHATALSSAGFDVVEIPIERVSPFWPVVSRIHWQLAFYCRKAPRIQASRRRSTGAQA